MKKVDQQEIIDWLNSHRPWAVGLKLYAAHGNNDGLKKIFERTGDTVYNRNKLVEELYALSKKGIKGGKPKPKRTVIVREEGDPKIRAGTLTHPRLKVLYKQRSALHAELFTVHTDLERRERALAILDLTDEIEAVLTGKNQLPKDKGFPKDRAALMKKLLANRVYISRFRADAKKSDEVVRRAAENDQIEKLLENEDQLENDNG